MQVYKIKFFSVLYTKFQFCIQKRLFHNAVSFTLILILAQHRKNSSILQPKNLLARHPLFKKGKKKSALSGFLSFSFICFLTSLLVTLYVCFQHFLKVQQSFPFSLFPYLSLILRPVVSK